MISPRRAPVRPRVISSETGETLLLEEVVDSCAGWGCCGALGLVGGPRTGKTTALAHLASLPMAGRLMLVDDARPAGLPLSEPGRLVVYATRQPLETADLRYELAPWCDDDLIEYLLATCPDRCPSVMARFRADGNGHLLDGKPGLVCIVADQMAANESVHDIRTALRRGIAERARDEQTLQDARVYAAAVLLGLKELAEECAQEMVHRGIGGELLGLVSYPWVELLLTADLLISTLRAGSEHPLAVPDSPYPGHGSRTGFYTNDYDDQSFKAPEAIRKANLCGADLRGAYVAGVDFYLVDLRGARYDQEQAAHFRRCDAILFGRTT